MKECQGVGFKVWGVGLRVQGLCCRALNMGSRQNYGPFLDTIMTFFCDAEPGLRGLGMKSL